MTELRLLALASLAIIESCGNPTSEGKSTFNPPVADAALSQSSGSGLALTDSLDTMTDDEKLALGLICSDPNSPEILAELKASASGACWAPRFAKILSLCSKVDQLTEQKVALAGGDPDLVPADANVSRLDSDVPEGLGLLLTGDENPTVEYRRPDNLASCEPTAVRMAAGRIDQEASCQFYVNLEANHWCSEPRYIAQLAHHYPLDYGYKYCRRFARLFQEYDTPTSQPTKTWIGETMNCLHQRLRTECSTINPRGFRCDVVSRTGFDSHPDCYTGNNGDRVNIVNRTSICTLPPRDMVRVLTTVDMADLFTGDSMRQIEATIRGCGAQYLGLLAAIPLPRTMRALTEAPPVVVDVPGRVAPREYPADECEDHVRSPCYVGVNASTAHGFIGTAFSGTCTAQLRGATCMVGVNYSHRFSNGREVVIQGTQSAESSLSLSCPQNTNHLPRHDFTCRVP